MPHNDEKERYLSTARNALRILSSFTLQHPEKRVSEIAEELGLGKSTVSRLLSTLASEGYVIKEPANQKYRLGLKILELHNIVTSQLEINQAARQAVRRLVKDAELPAIISVLEEEVVHIDHIETSPEDPVISSLGFRSPVHCTSSGKLLLAYHEAYFFHRIVRRGLASFTMNTITDPDLLREQLAEIRKKGFAYCESEHLPDISSLSVPIRNYSGIAVASLTVAGKVSQVKKQMQQSLTMKMIRAASEISANLGYYGK